MPSSSCLWGAPSRFQGVVEQMERFPGPGSVDGRGQVRSVAPGHASPQRAKRRSPGTSRGVGWALATRIVCRADQETTPGDRRHSHFVGARPHAPSSDTCPVFGEERLAQRRTDRTLESVPVGRRSRLGSTSSMQKGSRTSAAAAA